MVFGLLLGSIAIAAAIAFGIGRYCWAGSGGLGKKLKGRKMIRLLLT